MSVPRYATDFSLLYKEQVWRRDGFYGKLTGQQGGGESRRGGTGTSQIVL